TGRSALSAKPDLPLARNATRARRTSAPLSSADTKSQEIAVRGEKLRVKVAVERLEALGICWQNRIVSARILEAPMLVSLLVSRFRHEEKTGLINKMAIKLDAGKGTIRADAPPSSGLRHRP